VDEEFDAWWESEQGKTMKGSRYIGKKAWARAKSIQFEFIHTALQPMTIITGILL